MATDFGNSATRAEGFDLDGFGAKATSWGVSMESVFGGTLGSGVTVADWFGVPGTTRCGPGPAAGVADEEAGLAGTFGLASSIVGGAVGFAGGLGEVSAAATFAGTDGGETTLVPG